MINKVREYITQKKLFSQDDHLLLAISGGADSVCLFYVLKDLGYKIDLAHCNFNLRSAESDKDEVFVKELAKKYALQCHVKSFDTYEYANNHKISIQMAARTLRYRWFNKLLIDNNLDCIITGHNQDDNIETFLINLVRGTGINGLCGMQPRNQNVIRPLLEISRKEIECYLDHRSVNYRNDSSNLDVKYLRNKIRLKLMPLLKEMNPSVKSVILDEISALSSVNKFFQDQIDVIRKRLLIVENNVYKINITDLINLDHIEIILFELLKPFGFFEVNKIINSLESQSGKRFFSENYQLIIDRKNIIISLLVKKECSVEILDVDSQLQAPIPLAFSISTDLSVDTDFKIAKLDFDKLIFPLKLRKWKHGDRFQPLGMANFKKLSDFFIDERYSILDKQKQWILCSGDDIVWIVGSRIDDRFKINSHTKKVYIAELLENN